MTTKIKLHAYDIDYFLRINNCMLVKIISWPHRIPDFAYSNTVYITGVLGVDVLFMESFVSAKDK